MNEEKHLNSFWWLGRGSESTISDEYKKISAERDKALLGSRNSQGKDILSKSFPFIISLKICLIKTVDLGIEAGSYFDMDIMWIGEGLDEVGIDKKSGNVIIKVDPKYFRPAEVEQLLGDATKAKKELGWEPKTSFEQLVKEMCTDGI